MDAVFIEFMENLWKIETLIYFVFPSRLYILEKYLSNKYFFRKKRKYVDNWLHFLVLPQRPTSYLHVISMIIFPITLMEEMAGSGSKGHEAGRCEGQADNRGGRAAGETRPHVRRPSGISEGSDAAVWVCPLAVNLRQPRMAATDMECPLSALWSAFKESPEKEAESTHTSQVTERVPAGRFLHTVCVTRHRVLMPQRTETGWSAFPRYSTPWNKSLVHKAYQIH